MSKTNVPPLDEKSFWTEIKSAPVPVLVEFGAAWCGPCRALAPIVDKLAGDRGDMLRARLVDVDASPGIAAELGVRSVPTVIVFESGKEAARHVGLMNREKLEKLVDRATSSRELPARPE